jgi:hypothetical protein
MTGMKSQALYHVVTLFECMQDPSTLAWLAQSGIPLPGEIPPGHYPAPDEIKSVLDALPGIRVAYQVSTSAWQATVTSRKDVSWASLVVQDYGGDPDIPSPFYFEGGWDEMITLVTSRLAKICGPLVLLHDSGAPPQVVM